MAKMVPYFSRYTWPVLFLLTGCSSSIPALERPEPPVPAQWPVVAQSDAARLPGGILWRHLFPDPRLQGLIVTALDHNRDLRLAIARVEEARALYGIAKADNLPTVNVGASRADSRTPGDLSPTGQGMVAQRHDVALGVTAFELDFWGRVKSLTTAAQASFLASAEARESFRLSLIAEVATAYLTLQEMEERLVLAGTTVANRQEFRFLVQKRREAGLAGDLELLAAEGAHEAAQAEVANLERSRAQADNALALLVGLQPTDLPAGRSLREQEIPLDLAVGAPSELLLGRPDVRAAEQRLMAANANIGAARAAFFPRINLSLTLGSASRTLTGLFDPSSGAWSYAPTLLQPLFDGGRNEAGLALAEARKVTAVVDYERTIQQIFREVADLLVARDHLAVQLASQERVERLQNQRLALAQARYHAGMTSYLDVLDAQRDATAAQQGTVQVRRALLVSAAQLYKALGGEQERRGGDG